MKKCQSMHQWRPTPRRMLVIIILLLSVHLAAPQQHLPQVHQRFRRSFDGQEDDDMDAGGAIYTRWGRTECPEDAQLIYAGATGGEDDNNGGGSANYVCLPLDPDYDYLGSIGSYYGIMYGTEYTGLDGTLDAKVENHNVPCAVCQSLKRRNLLMVPGKNTCYPGWHLEYKGYLVTERNSHKNNKVMECLDDEPETDQAGYRNEDGAAMCHVAGTCGSLPCPPYKESKVLTCAVCTK